MFHALLARLARGERPDGEGPVAELAATIGTEDVVRAEELVANYLETKGLPLAGNRTLAEIVERLLDLAADLRAEPLKKEMATVIDYYLAVSAPPKEAIDRIAMIAKGAGIDLGRRSMCLARRFERLEATASILAMRASPPSSAAASNIIPASSSRSRRRRRRRSPSRAAAVMTGCWRISARRARCRPSAPPSTPSVCSPPSGEPPDGREAHHRRPRQGPAEGRRRRLFQRAGLALRKSGHERGYRGALEGLDNVEVAFLSAAEIVHQLKTGRVHLGVTGEDLIRETIADVEAASNSWRRSASAAPMWSSPCRIAGSMSPAWPIWRTSPRSSRGHGRRLRVATKYMNLTRRFFAAHGVAGYRIVESVGATEGTPAAGTAELIVDITTTGTTLRANHLKVLEDGLILQLAGPSVRRARARAGAGRPLKLRDAILEPPRPDGLAAMRSRRRVIAMESSC